MKAVPMFLSKLLLTGILSCIVAIGLIKDDRGFVGLAIAQTTSPSLNGQQNPVPLSQQPAASTDVTNAATQAPGGITVPVAPGIGTDVSSSVGKSFGTAGRGLPGMPGGPPVNGALGGQDPSGKYMRPPVIPPVLCDPAIDLPC